MAARLLEVEVVAVAINRYASLISSHGTVIAITEVIATITVSVKPQSILIETILIIKWMSTIVISYNC